MLTKSDLDQIRKAVREEVTSEVKEFNRDLQSDIKLLRMELSLRLDKIENKLKDLEIRTTRVEDTLVKLVRDVSKVKKDINSLISYHDEYYVHL